MAIRVHDPDGTARRRAIRAAIAVPVGLAITLYLLDDPIGAAFTLFGMTGLLVNSDFAGSPRRRLTGYLLTGMAGSVALLLGWAASLTLVSAVLVTMAVAFGMTFFSMFRGAVSTGSASVLLVYIVAVCSQGQWSQMRDFQLGWWVAVMVSTIAALVLFPRKRRASNRPTMAAAFSAGANAARAAWVGERDDEAMQRFVTEFDQAIEAMDAHVAGQPFRTSGVTERDATLNILANQLDGIRLLVDEGSIAPPGLVIADFPERARLGAAIVAALEGLSAAMLDPHHVISATDLDRAREEMADGIDRWVVQASAAGTPAESISQQIAAQHQLRVFALMVEQMIELSRVANGGEVETLNVLPPIPRPSIRRRLSAQFAWQAPWLRNAIRTSVGLGLGVLVMNLTGVSHGFWVLLGVISVLRFDAVGTRKYALLAILGTAVGVIAGLLVFAVVGTSPVTLWILLPFLTFLAAWAAGAINFPSGQAAFSAMVLVALGILNWPPRQSDALVRVEDIAIGAGVALVVGLLLWPRGAAAYLRTNLAASIRSSAAYLNGSIASFTDPKAKDGLTTLGEAARKDVYRAAETFDIASVQRGPVDDLRAWSPTLSLTYLTMSVARIVAEFTRRYRVDETDLQESLDRVRTLSDRQWTALADLVDPNSVDPPHLPTAAQLAYPTLMPISDTAEARSLVITIWVIDWVDHLGRIIPDVLPADLRSGSPDAPA